MLEYVGINIMLITTFYSKTSTVVEPQPGQDIPKYYELAVVKFVN